MDNLITVVEEGVRAAAERYGIGDVERDKNVIRFQGEPETVAWAAEARLVPRTAGGTECEEGRLRGSEIGANRIERTRTPSGPRSQQDTKRRGAVRGPVRAERRRP